MFSGRPLIPCLFALLAVSACSSEPTSPSLADPAQVIPSVATCQSDPAQIESLIRTVFATGPNANSALGKWNNVIKQIDRQNNLRIAQNRVLDLIDFILKKRAQGQVVIDDATLTNLINQLLCYVGLGGIQTPDNTWVVNLGDPVQTFVTVDGQSGIQFPTNAVSELTIVTAVKSDPNALITRLDKYPFVYDWTLQPSGTLQNGAKATVGVCPDPASFADVPLAERQAVLDRLVLGHQRSATVFEVLARVPIPAAMTLLCGDIPDQASASRGLLRDITDRVVDWILPQPVMAAAVRIAGGGVGGNTSEFSPLGPVDPELQVGGVGGNTSEFSRLDAASVALPGPYSGTVGTQRTSGVLPTVTITTRRGTVIPGVGVMWTTSAPATQTPAGNATVCGANAFTNTSGIASVTCLDFGTTVNLPVAYTKLRATFTAPADLEADGALVITFEPAFQTWLVESYGPTALVFTSPPANRTVAAGNPYLTSSTIPVTVEIRSALGEVVPIATQPVVIILKKNSVPTGTVRTSNAVAGIASFSLVVPTAATGYNIIAEAMVAGSSGRAESNIFDVAAAGN